MYGESTKDGSSDETGYSSLFEGFKYPIVDFEMVGSDPIIRDVNPAFTEVFGYGRSEVIDEPLNDVIVPGFLSEEAAVFDRRTSEGKTNTATVRRETKDGIRNFVYHGIPNGDDKVERGFAVYADIHSHKQTESRLMVLHRILRHNLRNSITVISGFAEEIESVSEDEAILRNIRRIRERADYLSHISRESNRIKRALEKEFENRPIDIAEMATDICDEYNQVYPEASIRSYTEGSTCVKADPALSMAVKSLVENAVEHNDKPEPEVILKTDCCSKGDDWIELHVVDDAPVIPDQEKEAIVAGGDSYAGELRHGSGLGLWLVKWITESCEGVVEFRERETDRGNEVVLHLRHAYRS